MNLSFHQEDFLLNPFAPVFLVRNAQTKPSFKRFALEMHIYCKIIITIDLSILIIDRNLQILISNYT
jgi:hypothetical protein